MINVNQFRSHINRHFSQTIFNMNQLRTLSSRSISYVSNATSISSFTRSRLNNNKQNCLRSKPSNRLSIVIDSNRRSFSTPVTTTPSPPNTDGSHSDFAPKKKQTSQFPISDEAMKEINQVISSHPVVLFMKGSPEQPKCGFSANVVKILKHCSAEFTTVDVLENNEVRHGIKQHSDWPTLPQLYISGEFVGGSDIISQLFGSGELKQLLKDAGVVKQSEATSESQSQ